MSAHVNSFQVSYKGMLRMLAALAVLVRLGKCVDVWTYLLVSYKGYVWCLRSPQRAVCMSRLNVAKAGWLGIVVIHTLLFAQERALFVV